MGLQLKLSKVSLSADGSTLTVQDTTGAYNASTNPGGYGTPNPAPSTLVQLRWKLWEDCVWQLIAGTYSVANIQAGFAVTTINIGLSTTLKLLPDGVEEVQLMEGYAIATKTLGLVPGSNLAQLNSFSASDFVGIKYISFNSLPDEIFEILSIVGTTVTFDKPYNGVLLNETINQWYYVNLPVLIQTAGNNAINQDLTKITCDNLTGDALNNLMKRTMNSFAASARFDSGDYLGANTLALCVLNSTLIKRFGT